MKYSPAQIKKALVGAVTLLSTVAVAGLGSHLFPATWEPWLNLLLAVAGTYGVFKVENAPVRRPVDNVVVDDVPFEG